MPRYEITAVTRIGQPARGAIVRAADLTAAAAIGRRRFPRAAELRVAPAADRKAG